MAVNLFDVNFYRAANSDLAGFSNDQLLNHFQSFGLNEGRQFSPLVDLSIYRASNPDLAAAGLTNNQQLFSHLQNFGVAEGRRFSQFTDLGFYLIQNADVNQAFGGNRELAFNHLREYGIREGRSFSPYGDLDFYLAANSDVNQAFNGDRTLALQHLQLYGLDEGRQFSQFFDIQYYRGANSNSDLLAAGLSFRQLLEHFQQSGLAEGRYFSVAFDAGEYREFNSDLASAGLTNQQLYNHFQIYGLDEGRQSSVFLDVSYYLANNADLQALGFNNEQAYNHFVLYGQFEGRPAVPGDSQPGVTTVLYDNDIAELPSEQSWLEYATVRAAFPFVGNGNQTLVTGGTQLVSDTASYTGYSNYTIEDLSDPVFTLVNSAFPTLDRIDGFEINFTVQISSETHNNNDRAGFSIVAITDDLFGIELGFWTNQIWAQQIDSNNNSFRSSTEQVARNTTITNSYSLMIGGNSYALFATGVDTPILSGNLRNYSSFEPTIPPIPLPSVPNPYQTPNFLFFGDDTTSAGATVVLGDIVVVTY